MKDSRSDLLFLCHRIPFPPDKGDKIRSYRWLEALADRFRVHLGAFVDDPADWDHVASVSRYCVSTELVPLTRRWATVRALWGLLSGQPLTVPYYSDARMRHWVRDRMEAIQLTRVLVYSSAMAQYALGWRPGAVRRVMDFVDVDSEKWRQYASRRSWPASWLYRREAQRLSRLEEQIARQFDHSVFVSADEARLFARTHPGIGERVSSVSNGVDCDYFDPERYYPSPYPPSAEVVVFTGAMDYWANVDAVRWFTAEVWPQVKRARPGALFAVVGAKPGAQVRSLAGEDIWVTGRVPDVRPYLWHARCAVAPMRVARGIQNKVLEAMAMKLATVTTAGGWEGIDARPGEDLLVADEARNFAGAVLEVLGGKHPQLGAAARRLARERYGWANAKDQLIRILDGGASCSKVREQGDTLSADSTIARGAR